MSMKAILASFKKGMVVIPVLQDYIAKQNRLVEQGRRTKKEYVIRDARLTIKAFQERIDEFNHGEEIKGEYFHPSALGGCLRKSWFKAMNAPTAKESKMDMLRLYLILETGQYLHVILMNLLKRAKVLVAREVSIKDPVNKILGHCDAIIEVDAIQYVMEIKTVNLRWWTKLAKQPMFDHKVQIHCYMKALNKKWGIILYIHKDTSELREYVIQFDPDFYEKFCRSRIWKFFSSVKKKVIPDREEGDLCSFCPFIEICFDKDKLKSWMKKL